QPSQRVNLWSYRLEHASPGHRLGRDVPYVDDPAAPGGQRLNRAAFVNPLGDASGNPLRQGTLGRNALRGFAMSQVDLAVRRDAPLGGGVNPQLRAEAFNLFDQVSVGLPTNTLGSGLFGQATRTLASSLGAGGVAGGGFSPLYQLSMSRSKARRAVSIRSSATTSTGSPAKPCATRSGTPTRDGSRWRSATTRRSCRSGWATMERGSSWQWSMNRNLDISVCPACAGAPGAGARGGGAAGWRGGGGGGSARGWP